MRKVGSGRWYSRSLAHHVCPAEGSGAIVRARRTALFFPFRSQDIFFLYPLSLPAVGAEPAPSSPLFPFCPAFFSPFFFTFMLQRRFFKTCSRHKRAAPFFLRFLYCCFSHSLRFFALGRERRLMLFSPRGVGPQVRAECLSFFFLLSFLIFGQLSFFFPLFRPASRFTSRSEWGEPRLLPFLPLFLYPFNSSSPIRPSCG